MNNPSNTKFPSMEIDRIHLRLLVTARDGYPAHAMTSSMSAFLPEFARVSFFHWGTNYVPPKAPAVFPGFVSAIVPNATSELAGDFQPEALPAPSTP